MCYYQWWARHLENKYGPKRRRKRLVQKVLEKRRKFVEGCKRACKLYLQNLSTCWEDSLKKGKERLWRMPKTESLSLMLQFVSEKWKEHLLKFERFKSTQPSRSNCCRFRSRLSWGRYSLPVFSNDKTKKPDCSFFYF